MHIGLAGNDQSFLEEIDFNHGEGNLKTVKSGMTLFQRFPLYAESYFCLGKSL